MKRPYVKATLLSFAAFSFFHLALFCAYYLISVYTADRVLIYAVYFLSDFVSFLLPVTACAGMLAVARCSTRGRALLYGGGLALSRIFYEIPERTYGLLADGYDTGHAVLFSSLLSFVAAAAYFAVFLLLFLLVSRLFSRKVGDGDARAALTDRTGGAFAFDRALPFSLLPAVLLLFGAGLIREIVATVTFFSGSSGIYTAEEILYLVARYIFLFVLPFVLLPIGTAYAASVARVSEETNLSPKGGKEA